MVDRERPGRPYFYRTWTPGQPRSEEGPIEHNTANLGLGMAVGSDAVFFPFSELARAVNPYETEVGGQPVRIHFHPDGLTAWAEDNQERLLPGILAYRAGWLDFYPSSRVFKAVLGSGFWVLGNLESGRGLRAATAGRDVQEPRSPPQGASHILALMAGSHLAVLLLWCQGTAQNGRA